MKLNASKYESKDIIQCGYEILFINKKQDITLNSKNIDRNEL